MKTILQKSTLEKDGKFKKYKSSQINRIVLVILVNFALFSFANVFGEPIDSLQKKNTLNELNLVADTTIESISLTTNDSFSTIVPSRARNNYSPVKVGPEIDTIKIVVKAKNASSVLAINGTVVNKAVSSVLIPIQSGRNIINIKITAENGKDSKTVFLKIFRATPYPIWNKIAERSAWIPRDSAGELTFNGQMWLFGGWTPQLTSDVWHSSDGITWEQATPIPSKSGIDIPIVFVFNNKIHVQDVSGTLFTSEDNAKSWTILADNLPWKKRGQAGCVVFNDKIWVMGGRKGGELLNDVWSSSDAINWKCEVEHAPWAGRQFHNAPLVFDDKIWIIGGAMIGSSYHPFLAYNDVWNSKDGIHWQQVIEHAPWKARIWSFSVVYRNHLWLIGGFRSEPVWENLGDVWYSSDGVRWEQLENLPIMQHSGGNNVSVIKNSIWAPRHEMSVYSFNGKLWVVGGMVWPLVNDVWCLNISGLCFITQPVWEAYVNTLYEYKAYADFSEKPQKIKYRLKKSPTWLKINPVTGMITGTPSKVCDEDIVIEAYNDAGESVTQKYTLHILPLS
ncbi:MAG: hypothetical protein A2020_02560 [Lentisphaerae bacterium GWF2_45_14]|nr:MAG: hypothetical protein A2020_02560 [Lentisphaerae bacterium GWF2_45_14]